MKSRQVTQFICEFCGAKKYASWAMKQHEARCTKNPQRHCRMCCDEWGHPVESLLPKVREIAGEYPLVPSSFEDDAGYYNTEDAEAILNKVRSLVDGCPACTLALLRLSGLVHNGVRLDWQKESKSYLNDHYDPYEGVAI